MQRGRLYLTTICGTTARLQKGRMFSFTVDTTDVRLYARVVVFSFTVDTTDLFRRRRVVQVRERPPALRLVLAVEYGVEDGVEVGGGGGHGGRPRQPVCLDVDLW